MITRRSFLAALACLPFVGKYVPRDYSAHWKAGAWTPPLYPTPGVEEFPEFDPRIHATAGRGYMRVGDRWFRFEGNSLYELRDSVEPAPLLRPRLTFAEWDRTYQG